MAKIKQNIIILLLLSAFGSNAQQLVLGADKIDYLENYNIKKMVKEMNINKKTKLFIAYFIGKVRLIDNI